MIPVLPYRSLPLSRRQLLRRSMLGLSGLMLSGGLSSCGWRLGNVQNRGIIQSAANEMFIYTWAQYVDQELLKAFQTTSGIRAVTELFDSNEAMLAALQAGKGATFSIIYPSEYIIPEMRDKKLILPLDQSRLAGLTNLLPHLRQSPNDPGNRYGIPFSWGTTGLVYNSEKFPEAITDWDDLWKYKERLKRRMTLLNDPREVLGAALKSMGYSYNEKNPDLVKKAGEKLLTLKPYLANFTTDAWRDQIVAGDLWVAMGYSSDAGPLLQQNPKLKYIVPQSGSSRWVDLMVIPTTAPNVEGAYQWINFVMQPDVAAATAKRLAVTTPNLAAIELLPADVQHDPVAYPPPEILDRCEAMAFLDRSTAEVYDQAWLKVTSS